MILFLLFALSAFAADPPPISIHVLHAGFRNPPPSSNLSPYWFWNGKVTAPETTRQLRAMHQQGVRSATIMNWAGLEPAYLSEPWWREVGHALDAARSLNITLNFADEYLWPSAQVRDYAGLNPEPSRVLQLHLQFRMKRLTAAQLPSGQPHSFSQLPEFIVAARQLPSGETDESSLQLVPVSQPLNWTPPAGNWTLHTYTAVPATERNTRTDLLNPAAVRAYLDLFYDPFARRFPQHLGSTVKFFVSDHEGSFGAPLPFTPALWDAFQRRHHYDLRPLLPLLQSNSPRAIKTRQDYLETVSYLYSTGYVQQVTDWCTRHNVQHGHSDIEETLLLQVLWTGDMFRLWRASSAIFIDALIERARMPIDFQEALSVAHFERRPLMVETHGLLGHDSFFSLEKSRLVSNMAVLWGANRLIPHYFEYDPTHIQYPPSIFLTQPQFKYFHNFSSTFHRALYLNQQGTHNANVAIYYPLESAFANSAGVFLESKRPLARWGNSMDETQEYYSALQLDLARHGWEYHILDSHYLQQASLTGKSLQLAGESFRALILPPMTHIAPASAEKLRRFAASGGLLLALGPQPPEIEQIPQLRRFPILPHEPFLKLDYLTRFETPAPVRQALAPLFDALRPIVAPAVEILEGSRENLFFSRRAANNIEWFWAVNDTTQPRAVTVRFPAPGNYEKWDPETGQRHLLSTNSKVTLQFGPSDAYFVVRNPNPSTAPPLPSSERRLLLDLSENQWQFAPDSPVRVPYATVAGQSEPLWLAPERLAQRDWWLSGPYPYTEHADFFTVPPGSPEPEADPRTEGNPRPTPTGGDRLQPVITSALPPSNSWQYHQSPTPAVRPPTRGAIYYAFTHLWSPTARDVRAALAVADGVKLWLNSKLEFTHHSHPPFVNLRDPWSHRPPLHLNQGWNTILLKIGPAQAGATGFLFRLTDAQNNTLRDITYTKDKTLPPPSPPRIMHLTVALPPGAAGNPISEARHEQDLPERPYLFQPNPTPTRLFSWTNTTLANYSGTATYETTFTITRSSTHKTIYLDLGQVGLAAEVWLNGKSAGSRSWSPYEFDVTALLQPGPNRLRVRVANSDAGWMSQGPPIYERGAWGIKFASERDRLQTLRPNGLEGPVRLTVQSAP